MKRSSAAYWLLAGSLLMLIMGTNVPSTLYGIYREEWGFSNGILTSVFAAYVAGLIPALLVFGHLSDVFGRRKVALSGLALAAAASFLFIAAESVAWLFAARFVQGLAVGMASGAITAALAESNPRKDRKQASLAATAALTAGGGIGPLFGAMFAQYAPHPLTVPYAAYLALFVPVVIALRLLMPETAGKGGRTEWWPRRPRIPAERRRSFAIGAASCFSVWAVVGFFSSLVPSYVASLLRTQNLLAGGGVIFTMFACSLMAQILFKKLPSSRAVVAGAAATVAGLVALVAAVPAHSVALLLAASAVGGAGVGLGFMGGMNLVSEAAPSGNRAEVMSAAYVILYVGVGLPTVLVGFASDRFGLFASVAGFAAAIAALSTLIALFSVGKSFTTSRTDRR